MCPVCAPGTVRATVPMCPSPAGIGHMGWGTLRHDHKALCALILKLSRGKESRAVVFNILDKQYSIGRAAHDVLMALEDSQWHTWSSFIPGITAKYQLVDKTMATILRELARLGKIEKYKIGPYNYKYRKVVS